MVEVTQADRDAAEAIYPAFLASLQGEDGGYGLAEAFARHRTTSLAAHDGPVDALRQIADSTVPYTTGEGHQEMPTNRPCRAGINRGKAMTEQTEREAVVERVFTTKRAISNPST